MFLRSTVMSLVALVLALSTGIVLGAGPLQGDAQTADDTGSVSADVLAAALDRADTIAEGAQADEAFAAAVAPRLVRDALPRRAVTLLVLPGAEAEAVAQVEDLLARAGSTVTARVQVTETLIDVGDRQLVSELASQLAAGLPRADRVRQATGYELAGALLARAVVGEARRGEEVDRAAENVLAGFRTAALLDPNGTRVDLRGNVVLAVAGSPYGTDDDRAGAGDILTTLLLALDRAGAGTVLFGPPHAAGADGLLGILRGDAAAADEVSSVDTAGRSSGSVAAVLALAADLAGDTGHWGTAASPDGPVPPAADR